MSEANNVPTAEELIEAVGEVAAELAQAPISERDDEWRGNVSLALAEIRQGLEALQQSQSQTPEVLALNARVETLTTQVERLASASSAPPSLPAPAPAPPPTPAPATLAPTPQPVEPASAEGVSPSPATPTETSSAPTGTFRRPRVFL